jgi:hypothetical protein
MTNKYYKAIPEAFEPTNASTYHEIFTRCKVNPYSSIAGNRFRYAWNDLFASGKIERIGDSEPFKYCINQ